MACAVVQGFMALLVESLSDSLVLFIYDACYWDLPVVYVCMAFGVDHSLRQL